MLLPQTTFIKYFRADKLAAEIGKGVSLWGDKLCILSTQHQLLTVLWISGEGKFEVLQKIGRFCDPEDDKLLPTLEGPAYTEVCYKRFNYPCGYVTLKIMANFGPSLSSWGIIDRFVYSIKE